MNLKSLKTQFIGAIAMVLVAAVAMGSSTYAWFAMNRHVEAKSMTVKATTGASLVISKSTNFTASTVEVTLNTQNVILEPATKFVDQESAANTAITADAANKNLVKVSNPEAVNPTTGLAKANSTLYYTPNVTAAAPNDSADAAVSGNYYDYVVYLAAEGNEDLKEGKLQLTIPAVDFAEGEGEAEEKILEAVTIMVYINDILVNTVDPIHINVGSGTNGTAVDLKTLASTAGDFIPKGAPGDVNSAMKVTLRTYLDGAYIDSTADPTATYVKNASIVDLNRALTFNAQFDVVAAS